MAVALMLTTGRRTTKKATSLIQDNYKINGIKRLELKKTKTSKKSKFVSFKLGDEAVNILNTIYLRVTNALNLVENLYFS